MSAALRPILFLTRLAEAVLMLSALLVWWGDQMLQVQIDRQIEKLRADHGVEARMISAKIPWPTRFQADRIYLRSNLSTLEIDSVRADFSWFSLLTGSIRPHSLSCAKVRLLMSPPADTAADSAARSGSWPDRLIMANKRLRQALTALPSNLDVERITVVNAGDSLAEGFVFDGLRFRDQEGGFRVSGPWGNLRVSAAWDSERCSALIAGDTGAVSASLPMPLSRFISQADTLDLQCLVKNDEEMEVKARAVRALIDHKAIHHEAFILPESRCSLRLSAADGRVALESAELVMGRIALEASGQVEFDDSGAVSTAGFRLLAPLAEDEDWKTALPEGVFKCLESVEVKGRLGFELALTYDAHAEIPVKLDAQPKRENLRWVSGGKCDLSRMSGQFTYRPWGSKRSIFLGQPGVDRYTALDNISPLLRSSVLNAEDGGFFWHRGFNDEALAESLLENLKRGYFRRGGSTISMQLVKNAFLSRRKTLTRKMEEIALVWLIEHFRLTSKERMFEMYLNLIEWGPEIYGIREASEYYFSTSPERLSLEQSIFLASIIPAPRAFRFRFNSKGDSLRDFNDGFFRLIARKLVQQKIINDEQAKEMDYRKLRLTGRAAEVFRKTDIVPKDSLTQSGPFWLEWLRKPDIRPQPSTIELDTLNRLKSP